MTTSCNNDSPQFIKCTLAIVGDKYSALILRNLHEKPMRFKDFEVRIPEMSPRTLTQRLEKLQETGIIEKQALPDSPARHEYHLSKAGKELDEVIHAMAMWGKKHANTIKPVSKNS